MDGGQRVVTGVPQMRPCTRRTFGAPLESITCWLFEVPEIPEVLDLHHLCTPRVHGVSAGSLSHATGKHILAEALPNSPGSLQRLAYTIPL
jgi:hypothetical protein